MTLSFLVFRRRLESDVDAKTSGRPKNDVRGMERAMKRRFSTWLRTCPTPGGSTLASPIPCQVRVRRFQIGGPFQNVIVVLPHVF